MRTKVCASCGSEFEYDRRRHARWYVTRFCSDQCARAARSVPPPVANANGCLVWAGHILRNGYGTAWDATRRKTVSAHRQAYEREVGPISPGLTLDHLCRNRACVNPAHLEPVTNRVNQLRGESFSAVNARKVECIHGHNRWHVLPSGKRQCMECHRLRKAERSVALRGALEALR